MALVVIVDAAGNCTYQGSGWNFAPNAWRPWAWAGYAWTGDETAREVGLVVESWRHRRSVRQMEESLRAVEEAMKAMTAGWDELRDELNDVLAPQRKASRRNPPPYIKTPRQPVRPARRTWTPGRR